MLANPIKIMHLPFPGQSTSTEDSEDDQVEIPGRPRPIKPSGLFKSLFSCSEIQIRFASQIVERSIFFRG